MRNVRPDDAVGLPLARARVLGALFGEQSGRFGRFRVLEQLGAGAMGVVYAAYDPDLDRGVALKLINVSVKDRQAALAEAKALGRLSHPNVVPIYDVGIEGAHVYLVMELVRGKTLRHWIQGRRRSEILDVYQQAGAALAAAHMAGLVHRDFKPDNAIVGADGRVRVVDFGLACEADEPTLDGKRRPAAGTPHYMAPEIAAGTAVTAAADQYSFCVALHDALASLTSDPMPRRLNIILERARAGDPNARYASMGHLLRALSRATTSPRRRIAVLTGVATVLGAAASLVGQWTLHAADEQAADNLAVCDAGATVLTSAWTAVRAAELVGIAGLGSYGRALQPQFEGELTAYTTRWENASRSACRDRLRNTESDTLSDRRTACLRRGSDAISRLDELLATAHAENLVDLARAARSLPDPALCSDPDAFASDVAPPRRELAASIAQIRTQLARAGVDLDAGRYTEARDAAKAAVAHARALDYKPVIAEALLLEGHAQGQMRTEDDGRIAAAPILLEAASTAVAVRADSIAVEAWARYAWAKGTTDNAERALDGVEVIQAIAERTPSATFARALLYNNIGVVELARGRRAKARRAFERALAASHGFTGDGVIELAAIRANLALVTDDHAAGDKLIVEAEAELTRLLGKDHPDTLELRWRRGTTTIAGLAAALEVLRPTCQGYELHGVLAERKDTCWSEVGRLYWELGDRASAIDAMKRAGHTSQTTAPASAAYVALWRGDAAAASRELKELLERTPVPPNDQWWEQRDRFELLSGLGQAQRRSNHLAEARVTLKAAVVGLATITSDHPSIFNERRLGRARVELALALESLHATPSELIPVVASASKWLHDTNSPSHELDRLSEHKHM